MKPLLSKAVSQKMKNREYWQKRFEELEDRRMKEAAAYYRDVEKQFRRAQNKIEKDMERWYQRLADNNGISYAAAKRLLNKKELAEFQWTLEEYIKKGKENAISPRWMKELENASAKVHITHLEGMKTAIQQYNEVLFAQLKEGLTGHLSKVAEESFYRNAYEIAKGTGIGKTVPYFDSKKLEIILNQTWAADGTRFSDRIWNNKQKLVGKLHTELTQSIIRGEAPDKAIQRLAKEMKVSEKQAGRLIMTETAAISSAADLKSYQELGIKKYQILATLDNKTSLICQDMDHKVFDIKDYRVGMTAPPFHPYCRTTTIPYFEDEFTIGEQRAAKDEETGKTYYVPASMSYQEWKQIFVNKKKEKNQKLEVPIFQDERIKNAYHDFSKLLLDSKGIEGTVQRMLFYSEMTDYVENKNIPAAFSYSPSFDVIYYNPDAPNYELYDMNFVQAHELTHRIDILEIHSWENQNFIEAIENTREKIYDNVNKITDWFSDGGKYESDMALSDIFSALSYGSLNDILYSGHPIEYWQEDISISYLEIFANIASIDVLNYDSKEEFSNILKEIYEAYKELMK